MKFNALSDGTIYWMHRVYDGRWHVGAYHPYVEIRPERFADDITVASDLQGECLNKIFCAPLLDHGGAAHPWFEIEGQDPPLPPVMHDVLIARRPELSALRHAKPIVSVGHINRDGALVLSDTGAEVIPIAWTLLPEIR